MNFRCHILINTLIVFISITTINIALSQANKIYKQDTLINFGDFQNYARFTNSGFHNNYAQRVGRYIPFNGKIHYVSIPYENDSWILKYEYFWLTDSTYYFQEYTSMYHNCIASGVFKVGNIVKIDTFITDNHRQYTDEHIHDDTLYQIVYFKELIKTGEWIEYSTEIYPQYWKGCYNNGVKTGIWRYFIYKEGSHNPFESDRKTFISSPKIKHKN